MGTFDIFSAMDPEEYGRLVEKRRQEAFLHHAHSRSSWVSRACRHKHAADILYEVAHAASARKLRAC